MPVRDRVSLLYRARTTLARRSPEFAEWLRSNGMPLVAVLEVVDVTDRWDREAHWTRALRRHGLFNVKDGYRHTPESKARISAGVRAHLKASRRADSSQRVAALRRRGALTG